MTRLYPVAALLLATIATPAMAESMAMDTPTQMNGLETVCTGVGSGKDDPRWLGYPIRIEFSNGGAQNISGAHVVLTNASGTVADLDCAGPWVLLKGKPGNYHVSATIDGSGSKPATASFMLGTGGPKRVILRFDNFQANE
jgi:hypothetical protein